ncbi:DNA primase [Desulfonema ishimotonii]|uniref:DNA primase n=1 Tax=Desulfonema ishimotonii TaxID=45657 RepID=A0A401FSZ5_9BACT|nr:DNA primase [Desulfonema ishimotonii]GBC60076.1 DNA primase [Desulfonema ishimotonii]
MSNYIPEEKILEIQHAADIVDVISDVVMLKKSGRDYVGLCPFHSEKTPSFTVSRGKQMFYCFGCGVGGNLFSFLMKHEGLSFPETVRLLAGRYGIEMPTPQMSPEQRQRMAERERILYVNRQAADFFGRTLAEEGGGQNAQAYLDRRGIDRSVTDTFGLGYARPGWDYLLRFLTARGIDAGTIAKAGLVIPRKGGNGFYDRFRERIIFPIFDIRMQVSGFGGRVLDDALPKYLNSPETPVFNKSRSLYGLHAAKRQCRDLGQVFVTEGYFDVITLWQQGIRNVVATLGTALTPEHVRLLRGYARQVILVYDSDQAGIRAALRGAGVFRAEKMDARILILPEGHDPDSFVRAFGPDAFIKKARNAVSIMAFLTEEAVRKYGLSVEGKMRILSDMMQPLAEVTDRTERTLYVRELASRIGVDGNIILEKLRQGVERKRGAERRFPPPRSADASPVRARQTDVRMPALYSRTARIEEKMVSMMLQFPEILPEIENRNLLSMFENGDLRAVGEIILRYRAQLKPGGAEIIDRIEDEQKRQLAVSLAFKTDQWTPEGCLMLIEQFESGRKRREDNIIQREIEAAIRANDRSLLNKLLKERLHQARERQSIT